MFHVFFLLYRLAFFILCVKKWKESVWTAQKMWLRMQLDSFRPGYWCFSVPGSEQTRKFGVKSNFSCCSRQMGQTRFRVDKRTNHQQTSCVQVFEHASKSFFKIKDRESCTDRRCGACTQDINLLSTVPATDPGVVEAHSVNAEASQSKGNRGPRRRETVRVQTQSAVPASSGALRAAGVAEWPPPIPVRLASNRFFSLATDSEDEQVDRRTTVDDIGQRNSRRRLRLRWSECVPPAANPAGDVQECVPDVPDSHVRRSMQVRAALQRDCRPLEVRRAAEMVRRAASIKRLESAEPFDANGGQHSYIPLVCSQCSTCPSQCAAWRCLGTT